MGSWRWKLSFLSLFLLLAWLKSFQQQNADKALNTQIETSANHMPAYLFNAEYLAGFVKFENEQRLITEPDIHAALARIFPDERNKIGVLSWYNSRRDVGTLTAAGEDFQQHFVNSYLVGIRPFAVDNDWLPLYVLAKRKTYQLDQQQYGQGDVWQTSAAAYSRLRGDCEDHALALADWLISEGLDARVAIGKYRGEGHAWVVVFKDNQQYLLEATSKSRLRNWNYYPLVQLATGYVPQYMFNRSQLWALTGSDGIRDYQHSQWQLRSQYTRTAAAP